MGSFGERLRREREMRGIGLEEIATATKISTRNLRALEDEKFDQLPGGIFNKGFVRAYARFLGIDDEHIIAEYEAASRESEAAREQKLQELFAKAEMHNRKKGTDPAISLEPKSQWGTIAIIVLVAALAYVGYNYYQRKKIEQQRIEQAQASAPVLPTSTQVPESNAAQASSAGEANNSDAGSAGTDHAARQPAPAASSTNSTGVATNTAPVELTIKVNYDSWISIKADGKSLLSATLTPGTERSFTATDKIEMVLGNPGGVELSYNGKRLEGLGSDVLRITFTPSGYE